MPKTEEKAKKDAKEKAKKKEETSSSSSSSTDTRSSRSGSSSSSSSSRSSSSSSSSTDTRKVHSRAASSSGEPKEKKKIWIKRGWDSFKHFSRRLVPDEIYYHGRTVYGGNPVIQQTLPGWFAYLSPFFMIPIFFLFMIPFIVVGALMIVESRKVYVLKEDYSQIHQYQYTPKNASININQGIMNFTVDGVNYSQGTLTWKYIYVEKYMKAPVYFYYTLDNYYQNFRDFHDGRDMAQLKGDNKELGSATLCKPFVHPGYRRTTPDGQDGKLVESVIVSTPGGATTYSLQKMKYNPCGLAAWATFNDTFVLYQVVDNSTNSSSSSTGNMNAVINSGANGSVPMRLLCNGTAFDAVGTPTPAAGSNDTNYCSKKGISFTSDVTLRYRPLVLFPSQWSRNYPYPTNNSYLNAGYYYKEAGHPMPDPADYDFQVWMRSAVLSSFKKLYRIINIDLEPGWYAIQINEFYDVVSFKGRKGVALRRRHWVGENNTVLGILLIIIGCLCFVLGVAFFIEYQLQRKGRDRLSTLKEPKRTWYVFDSSSPAFEQYYHRRLLRHVPVQELTRLRELQDEESSDVE